jgi:hypothetical protein
MTKVYQPLVFRGFTPSPHYLALLVKEGKISVTTLGWYYILLGLTDFDFKHATYGCINKDSQNIARELNAHASTLNRLLKRLGNANLTSTKLIHGVALTSINHYWQFDIKVAQTLAKLTFPNYGEVEMLLDWVESENGTINSSEQLINIQQKIAEYALNFAETRGIQVQKRWYNLIRPYKAKLSSPPSSYISSTNSKYLSEDIDIPNANSILDIANKYEGYDY